jgi:5-methyltetrahydropteroyltriglutamate--homocysteine methyltransferase
VKDPAVRVLARLPRLPTTLVGSYVQPDWLVDRDNLGRRAPPRVRAEDIWRVPAPQRAEAFDDATVLAIREQERAGLDIIGDGEIRRESYSCTFATALGGIDAAAPGSVLDRRGKPSTVPRVLGPVRWQTPILEHDVALLRRSTTRAIKMTLPGPFTLAQLAQDEHYRDPGALAMAFAAAVNAEIRFLHAAGADIVQIDEPYLEVRPAAARDYGLAAIDEALRGVTGATALHICFGYGPIDRGFAKPGTYAFLPELERCEVDIVSLEAAQPRIDLAVLRRLPSKVIMLGVLDLGTLAIETVDQVCTRIGSALEVVGADRLVIAPDCGMKYLTRGAAAGKTAAMVAAAATIRARL